MAQWSVSLTDSGIAQSEFRPCNFAHDVLHAGSSALLLALAGLGHEYALFYFVGLVPVFWRLSNCPDRTSAFRTGALFALSLLLLSFPEDTLFSFPGLMLAVLTAGVVAVALRVLINRRVAAPLFAGMLWMAWEAGWRGLTLEPSALETAVHTSPVLYRAAVAGGVLFVAVLILAVNYFLVIGIEKILALVGTKTEMSSREPILANRCGSNPCLPRESLYALPRRRGPPACTIGN